MTVSTNSKPVKGGISAIELLEDDHKAVRDLLSQLEGSSKQATSTRPKLLEKIRKMLSVHTTLEEEIFYPAARKALDSAEGDKMYFEALEEHRVVEKMVLPDLEKTDPGSDQFSGRAKVLKELVEHHADEEEEEMFPKVKKAMSSEELLELGRKMQVRKATLMQVK
jgi:hemerythrin superfamily protein